MDRTELSGHDGGKARFALAPDPDLALREFFAELGENAAQPFHNFTPAPTGQRLPLILISQLPRSGGSLFSQLCDGHRQLLVHPSEMRIGFPSKDKWPALDLNELPERLFAMLFQSQLGRLAKEGYIKPGKAKHDRKRLHFGYSPSGHYRAFVKLLKGRMADAGRRGRLSRRLLDCLSGREGVVPFTRRTVLDSYFESLFQAWPRGRVAQPRFVVGFLPRMALNIGSIAEFFTDYSDGRLVTIMRNPADWFVSRRAHTKKGVERYSNLENEMAIWNRMAANAITYRELYKDRFSLLSFNDLVTDREGTMRRFAKWCRIDFTPELLSQTFCGEVISPNTNFDDSPEQRPEAVLERHARLTLHERKRIVDLTETMRGQLQRIGCQW